MPIHATNRTTYTHDPGTNLYTAICDACRTTLANTGATEPRQFLSEAGAVATIRDHGWFVFRHVTICKACLDAHVPKPPIQIPVPIPRRKRSTNP